MRRLGILPVVQALTDALVTYAALAPDAGGSPVPLQACYAFAPEYDPATDLQILTVTVVPRATQVERASRAGLDQHFEIDLGIQRQLQGQEGEVEKLLEAVVALDDFIRNCDLSAVGEGESLGGVEWVGSENTPIYAVEHLRRGVFTSVLTVTYRLVGGSSG